MKSFSKYSRRGLPGGPNEIIEYMTGSISTDGFKFDSEDVDNDFNIIPSGSITMEDVMFPVLGIDNLGNSQMMMPEENYEFPGDMVFELPMARNGLEKYQNLGEVDQVYLGDFTITDADFNALNDPSNPYVCDPSKGCLASAFDAYDAVVGNFHSDFPSEATLKDDLELQSLETPEWGDPSGYKYDYKTDQFFYIDENKNKTPVSQTTDEWIRSIPYFKTGDPTIGDPYEGGRYDFTADSWDIHGVLVEKGGLNLLTGRGSFTDLSESERLDLYSKLAPGTIIGFSEDDRADRDGYNKAMGLSNSSHSTIVVGFAEDGVPIIYDYGSYRRLDEGTLYELEYLDNITIPSNLLNKTRDNLAKDESLNAPPTEFNVNTNYLYSKSDKDDMGSFYSALKDNKNQLMLDLKMDNDEYDFVAKTLLGIALSESEGGSGFWYGVEGGLSSAASFLSGDNVQFGETHGLTQLNIKNLLEDEQLAPLAKKYGITSSADLEDPYKAGIASMLYGWRNNKSAKANFEKGKDGGIRTYYAPQESEGLMEGIENIGRDVVRWLQDKEQKFDGETFVTDEGPKVDLNGSLFARKTLKEAQKELDGIAPGKYTVKKDSKGNYYVEVKTEGNADLTPEQMFIYNWQTPNSLLSGDAQGDNAYVNKTLDYIDNFKTGGQNDILLTDFGKSLIQDPRYRKARKQLGADTMARIARILG